MVTNDWFIKISKVTVHQSLQILILILQSEVVILGDYMYVERKANPKRKKKLFFFSIIRSVFSILFQV